MNGNHVKKGLVVLTVIAVVGFGANALAGWGKGYGRGQGRGWGYGGNGPGYCEGYGPGRNNFMGNLSDEAIKKLDAERERFFNETDGLRQNRFSKRLELRSELAKENPDAARAAALQKALSDLDADLAQKRIAHILKMKEINPNAGRFFRRWPQRRPGLPRQRGRPIPG